MGTAAGSPKAQIGRGLCDALWVELTGGEHRRWGPNDREAILWGSAAEPEHDGGRVEDRGWGRGRRLHKRRDSEGFRADPDTRRRGEDETEGWCVEGCSDEVDGAQWQLHQELQLLDGDCEKIKFP